MQRAHYDSDVQTRTLNLSATLTQNRNMHSLDNAEDWDLLQEEPDETPTGQHSLVIDQSPSAGPYMEPESTKEDKTKAYPGYQPGKAEGRGSGTRDELTA